MKDTSEILKEAGGYEGIIKGMEEDLDRTKRQREVESCFGKSLPAVLRELHGKEDSKAAMLRRINEALEANNFDGSLSRPTLYSWLDTVELDE